MRLRIRANECQLTLLREDDEVAAGEHDLAVAVTAALPFQLAIRCIEAGQDRFVETVNESVVQHRAREVIVHPVRAPELSYRELPVGAGCQLEHRGIEAA